MGKEPEYVSPDGRGPTGGHTGNPGITNGRKENSAGRHVSARGGGRKVSAVWKSLEIVFRSMEPQGR